MDKKPILIKVLQWKENRYVCFHGIRDNGWPDNFDKIRMRDDGGLCIHELMQSIQTAITGIDITTEKDCPICFPN
jgi:hypothetical protein|tara:strand:- start:773 stop:997 length:225 start_codon:yes stop_codon:yes gene_type:complete